ncbi:unnamed protein product [Brachionus calyciflorus]|uniref:Uncharacterized protein n=1 Tax=Brachionus calyciflorus TaxID=104777 RepID=A0A814L3S8_9BILA|nr:unnamed protein product [Brachionus calyciflorus]
MYILKILISFLFTQQIKAEKCQYFPTTRLSPKYTYCEEDCCEVVSNTVEEACCNKKSTHFPYWSIGIIALSVLLLLALIVTIIICNKNTKNKTNPQIMNGQTNQSQQIDPVYSIRHNSDSNFLTNDGYFDCESLPSYDELFNKS